MSPIHSQTKPLRLAFFITPHGFGHAARASSLIEALHKIRPEFHFEIFTTVPRWFFTDSLSARFSYHSLLTDIGMIQQGPLREDVSKTIESLDGFYPFSPELLGHVARKLTRLRCRIVLCDIAALGIAIAKKAGIPSVLMENFTWDWIYEGYVACNKHIAKHIDYLKHLFNSVDHHIQTEPVCSPQNVDLLTPPMSRAPRTSRERIRSALNIRDDEKVVLVTMGGIQGGVDDLEILHGRSDVRFIVPGTSSKRQVRDNMIVLPHHSGFFHPDLVNASDAVIGKLGYSTLAEAYHAGLPFGYVSRRRFRESEVLARFVERNMKGLAINEEDFLAGRWMPQVPHLLEFPRRHTPVPNGSKDVAGYISKLL
ncbi:MAG: hypothetical protein JRI36_08165 [Deltaproteobacteria bacterium]|nr:hypothetical protein [Deltaproteobacteria bacterium]